VAMIGPRHEIARLQSDFYRDQFRKVLRWLVITIIIIFLLLAAILYDLFLFQPERHYYANTIDGKILEMPQPRGG
jgi:uncharacterized membrane protein (DUF106 family)